MKGAKLWKRILNEGFSYHGEGGSSEVLANAIIKATIIVCPTFDAERAKARRFEEYSHVAIPFDSVWIERSMTDKTARVLLEGMFIATGREEKWNTLTVTEILATDGTRPALTCSWQLRLSTNGTPILESSGQLAVYTIYQSPGFSEQQINEEIRSATFDLLDMLSMLSCRNVSLADHDNDPKQVRRAIKRHGGNPDSYRYHTLVVRPPGAKSDSPAQEIGIMPRHVCRGHFSEYGPQFNKGLLFGKYSGRFFVPPHLRGDKKNGVVEKDYAIPAGNENRAD